MIFIGPPHSGQTVTSIRNTGEKDGPGESMAAIAVGLFIAVAGRRLLIVLFGRSGHNLISIEALGASSLWNARPYVSPRTRLMMAGKNVANICWFMSATVNYITNWWALTKQRDSKNPAISYADVLFSGLIASGGGANWSCARVVLIVELCHRG